MSATSSRSFCWKNTRPRMRNREWATSTRTSTTTATIVAFLVAAFAGSAATQAKAKKRAPSARTIHMCVDAYDAGRQFESAARLREAKEMMLTCAQPSCQSVRHGFLRHDCLFRFSRIEASIPSVIPMVVDAKGEAIADVQVTMDGALLRARANGVAFPIDPGNHEFVFKKERTVLARRSFVVIQGQQNRPLMVTLETTAEN